MDDQYNQQTTDPQRNPYQQGSPYQQANPYQQGNSYQQANPYQQENPYQQNNAYQQGNPYHQSNPYQQGSPYQQANPYGNNGYGNYGSSSNYNDAQESQKAPNIFQQFALSFIPPQYGRLVKVRTGSMILFVTLLALVATLLSFVSLAIDFSSIDIEELVSYLPDFEISGGHFHIKEDFYFDEDEIFIYLTEDVDAFSYDDTSALADEGYRNILLVGRDSLSLMQDGQYQQADFSDLGGSMAINRDWIVDTLVPLITTFIMVGYIIFFLGRILWYFLCAAVYLLFALVIASIMHKQVPAEALFKTAVYAKVLMFVVVTVFSLIPFGNLSIPFIIRLIITVALMGFAIAKLPSQQYNRF